MQDFLLNVGDALALEIDAELVDAKKHGVEFVSLHEAYAVILEELDEVKEITWMKRKNRDMNKLHHELVQVATMAIKALHSMHNFGGGDV